MPESESEPAEKTKGGADWSKILTASGGVIAAVAALLTALNAIGVIGRQAASPTPNAVIAQATATRTPLFLTVDERFADPGTGWDSRSDDDAECAYRDGEYRILVKAPQLAVWANPGTDYDLSDLSLTVEAHSVAGTDDNEYGIVLRYVDRGNFYLFVVSSDGQYSVRMNQESEWVTLKPWARSTAIRQGQGTNILRVEARGPEMLFYANNELLTIVNDTTFASGSFGLAVGTFDEGGVEVRFDSLLVRSLP
jgi:hypothetical protein